jgi:cytosine/adenosine deaminase-related metal-dependent hydrolase
MGTDSTTHDREPLLIRGGRLYIADGAETGEEEDLFIEGGRIAARGEVASHGGPSPRIIDARGCAVLPGFVQTHVHLCQTLFRGLAEGLELTRWLQDRIWPLEAAHDPETLAVSARLGISELLLGGTTCVQDMGTVHHQESIFEAVRRSGIRATCGKAMMDGGEGVPEGLRETTDGSLRESLDLHARWHGSEDGRIRYAFAPRFALSVSEQLLRMVGDEAGRRGGGIHTHAAESRLECDLVQEKVGRGVIEYFEDLGLLGPNLRLAHCVWVTQRDRVRLASSRTYVTHCPTSNLKLGSGIADVRSLLDADVSVSLGADGAACNNTLDMFQEMRLAYLLPSYLHEPGAVTPETILHMATDGGARALGLEDEIGSIDVGKRADLIVLRLDRPHAVPGDESSLAARVVLAGRAEDVRTVIVGGRVLVDDHQVVSEDLNQLRWDAERAVSTLRSRAGF